MKIGKGKGRSYSFSLGMLEAQMAPEYKDITIRKLAAQLAKQRHIVDGEIEIVSLNFTFKKASS
jgi:hypothetical protein